MNDLVYRVALLVGWFVIVMVTSFLWTAVKVVSDNSMTKHKKVCDLCFRNIKLWNAEYKNIKVLHRSVEDIKEAVGEEEMPSTYKGVANFNDETNKEILTRNRFRKEILAALKIGNKGEK